MQIQLQHFNDVRTIKKRRILLKLTGFIALVKLMTIPRHCLEESLLIQRAFQYVRQTRPIKNGQLVNWPSLEIIRSAGHILDTILNTRALGMVC